MTVSETSIDDSAWVAPGAAVIGCPTLERRTSAWFIGMIRADDERIEIGEGSNVQEGAVLHTDPGYPLRIVQSASIGPTAFA